MRRMEAAPMTNLFDREFVKGKGMKNGGYGGLIIGKHYKLKEEFADIEKEKEKYSKWLSSYNKKLEQERVKRR